MGHVGREPTEPNESYENRTNILRFRKLVLYPVELRVRIIVVKSKRVFYNRDEY